MAVLGRLPGKEAVAGLILMVEGPTAQGEGEDHRAHEKERGQSQDHVARGGAALGAVAPGRTAFQITPARRARSAIFFARVR